jgi:hypothetical protein
MKMRFSKILQISALIFMMSSFVYSYDYGDGRYYCHSRFTEGNVYIQRANDAEISELSRNMPIMAGDRIWTEDGRAEIQFDDGSIINLDAGTKIDFEAIGDSIGRYEDSTLIKLWAGSIYATIFHDRDSSQNLQVQTMAGSISLLNRGSYRIDLGDDYSLRLTVFDGLAEVSNNRETAMVRSGQRLFLEPGDQIMDPVDFANAEIDEFSEWVMERTSHFSQTKSVQYVDDTLDYLVDEMDDYGDWRYSDDYDSYIWIPRTTYVYNDWRPYYNGDWVWTPHGWTFVSYDPWGWTTYRYGRWDWSPWGWCWIPGYRYSPAWVHWEIGYDYIGWAPMGYYNYPVSRYAWKDYPRGFKPRHGGVDIDVNTWTVVHKGKFGKETISKIAIPKADISKIDRKNAKTISADFAEKGFADRKINYTVAKSNVKNPVFRDLPEGAYNKLIKKNTSTGTSYSWSSTKQSSTSTTTGTYKKLDGSKSTGKYIYKSGGSQYYKKGSYESSGSKSGVTKDKSSYSRSRESSSSSSSSSSSKSSPTKSSSGSSSTSSPVKKKGDSVDLSSGWNSQSDNNNSVYRYTKRYTASSNNYSTKSDNVQKQSYTGQTKRSYEGNTNNPAKDKGESATRKSAYLYTVRDATSSDNHNEESIKYYNDQKPWNTGKTKSNTSSTWNTERAKRSYEGTQNNQINDRGNSSSNKWKYLFTVKGGNSSVTYDRYSNESGNVIMYRNNDKTRYDESSGNSSQDYKRTDHSNPYYSGGYQGKSENNSSSNNQYSKSNDKPSYKHGSSTYHGSSTPKHDSSYSKSSSSSSTYNAPSSNHGSSSISVKKKH